MGASAGKGSSIQPDEDSREKEGDSQIQVGEGTEPGHLDES